jgi:alpha-tubulin suppressor-like RCC1 family protein
MAVSVLVAAVMSLVVTAGTASAAFSGVAAWGHNSSSQLGTGSNVGPEYCGFESCSKVPVSVSGLSGVKSLAASAYQGFAVLNDGTVESWGAGVKSPTPVGGIFTATEVAAGENHSLALLEDGTVMAWGANYDGQLGDGTTTERSTPVPVSGLSKVVAIAAGEAFSLALLEDGTVKAWGYNYAGQLGNGTTTDSHTPVPVSGLSKVVAIAAGPAHSLALLEDGTVKAWGSNVAGQLGIGTNTGPQICKVKSFLEVACSQTPIAVSEISNAVSVAAGGSQGAEGRSFAVLEDGTVLGWGANWGGQLGIGSSTGPAICKYRSSPEFPCSKVPAAVIGLTEVESVAVGMGHNLALLESGLVMSWGFNQFGQLGDGTTTDAESPVAVDGLSGATVIAAGGIDGHDSYANGNLSSLPTVTAVEPNYGPPAGGTSVKLVGANLSAATAVKFGSANAESFTVDSPTEIHAVAPPGTGVVNVRVTTPAGTSPTDEEAVFNYSPIVTKVEPNDGPLAGGTIVKIVGGNFTGATAVKFGPKDAESFTVDSDTEIHAVSPEGYGGYEYEEGFSVVHVRVTGPGGTSTKTSADEFGYGPIIDRIEPEHGPAAGGTEITITGFALTEVEAVEFGSVAAASFTENPDGTVSAVSPALADGLATVPVTVTTPNGESTTCPCSSLLPDNYFRYTPTVTSIDPDEGPGTGGDAVTIHGKGFQGLNAGSEIPYVESVNFGSTELTCGATEIPWESCSPAEFEVKSETEIVATAPPGSGTVDVTVTTHPGTSPVSPADRYSYEPTGPTNRRTLTLTKSPDGNLGQGLGTVSSKPKGIKCAQACNEAVGRFYKEQEVILTAAPSGETSAFDKWVGCPTPEGLVCKVPKGKADVSIEAVFKGSSKAFSPAEALTLSKGESEQNFGWGTVKAAGLTCEAECDSTEVLYLGPTGVEPKIKPGKTVILKEAPAFGSEFVGWSGCTSISETECKVEMSEAKSVTAEFADLPDYALKVEKKYEGGLGAVSSKPKGINCANTCIATSANMPEGAAVLLTAKPAKTEPATTFVKWEGGDCAGKTEVTCTVTMDKAETVKAVFSGPVKTIVEPKSLVLTKEGSGYGTVKASGLTCEVLCTSATSVYQGPKSPKPGKTVTLEAASAPGTKPVQWSGCDTVTEGKCIVTMTGVKAVTATFDELE